MNCKANRIKLYCLFFFVFGLQCKQPADPIPGSNNNTSALFEAYDFLQQFYFYADSLPAKDQFDFITYNTVPKIVNTGIKLYSMGKDKWSFAIAKNQLEAQNTTRTSIGFDWIEMNDEYFISYVHTLSFASTVGLARGMKFVFEDETEKQKVFSALEQTKENIGFKVTTSTIESAIMIDFIHENFQDTNVLKADVFSTSNHSVAYLNIFSFQQPGFETEIDEAFLKFKDKNIAKMILDIRYNDGGSINNLSYLLNYLVCNDYNNKTMMRLVYNTTNTTLNQTMTFNKKVNSLCLDSIYFIISTMTAAGSEILINNLLPYIPNIKIIGYQSQGKFFGHQATLLSLQDYYIFPIAYQVLNALETQTKCEGFLPHVQMDDIPENDWNEQEASIAVALKLIEDPSVDLSIPKQDID